MNYDRFHIHVDAETIDASVKQMLIETYGFADTSFAGGPASARYHAPKHHLTLKCEDAREFRRQYGRTVDYVSTTTMRGYVEGEYVAMDVDLDQRPFDSRIVLPLSLQLKHLGAGQPWAGEVHVTMDRDSSDPGLIGTLCTSGLFAAYLPKRSRRTVVFTARGDRQTIPRMISILTSYLNAAGGSVAGSIKEERLIRLWLSDANVDVPPVVAALS